MFSQILHNLVEISLLLIFCSQEKTSGELLADPQNETLVITAYQRLQELYVDSQLQTLTNGDNWNLPDYLLLQPTNRLISLYAVNLGTPQCGGALASVYDGSLLTNSKWKCSPFEDTSWTNLGFDDSNWPYAVEYGINGNHTSCAEQHFFGNISSNSQWIWTDDLNNDFTAYCRGYLPFCENSSPCLNNGTCLQNDIKFCQCLPQYTGAFCETELHNETLIITAYQRLEELHIDGQLQPLTNGGNWILPDYTILQPTNRLIAVKAANLGTAQCGGVLASVYDGSLLTNNKWKCSPFYDVSWENLGFDDSSWPIAVEYGSNGNHITCAEQQFFGDISSNSQWIWTGDLNNDFIAYCRGYLPFCANSSPCLNNGTCLQNDIKFCQCLPNYTGAFCETELHNETLVITAYQRLDDLYVDGQPQSLTNGGNWNLPDYILPQPTNRLIALEAVNLGTAQCGGVLASVYDGSLLTNNKWKCSSDEELSWTNLGFDDSSWPIAVEYGSNGNHTSCVEQQFFGDMSSSSQWIWTSDLNNDFVVFCRGYLPFCENSSPCLHNGTCLKNNIKFCQCLPQYTGAFCETELHNETLVITAYQRLEELFIDGQPQSLTNGGNWNLPDYLLPQPTNRLIALMAVNLGTAQCGGVLASVYDGSLFTNNKWKCSSTEEASWTNLGFDDSNWPYAVEYGSNGNRTSCVEQQFFGDMSSNSQWIWTSDLNNDFVVYCRGYLPFCETQSPCLNGGTCLQNGVKFCECLPQYTGTTCETVKNQHLTITVKSTLHDLYIDGERQSGLVNQYNWTLPDEIIISPTNRLIGVMAIDSTETCAGVIGSVTDDYLVTDNINWRCSYMPDIDWYELGWNDTNWPLAHPIGKNANVTLPDACRATLREIPSISPNAYWIWTDTIKDPPLYHQTIYCRGYLPVCELNSPCYNGGTCNRNNKTLCTCLVGFTGEFCETVDLKNVSMTAKATLYAAYVDGNPINLKNGTDWQKTDNLRVNTTSRLLALMAVQLEDPCPGILASVVDSSGDYVLTSTSWKCSSTALVGWAELGYNDSSWQPARLIRKNEYTNDTTCQNELTEIPSISSDAYWIWTNNPSGQDVVAFCRGYLPICSVSPCKNGGTCNDNKAELCICSANYTGMYCESGRRNLLKDLRKTE